MTLTKERKEILLELDIIWLKAMNVKSDATIVQNKIEGLRDRIEKSGKRNK